MSISYLRLLNLKTIYFNFKYFHFRQAIRFPILVSRNVFLFKAKGQVQIDGPISFGMIRLGFQRVGIFDHQRSRTMWEVKGKIRFSGPAIIGHGTKISVATKGLLEIGSNVLITAESSIIAFNRVSIGNDCLLSWDILIADTDFHSVYSSDGARLNNDRPVKIENHVWIGSGCKVLKGSTIPSGSVLGAGSLVNKELKAENCLYGGMPVKILRENISWSH